MVDTGMTEALSHTFPPSFEGSPWSYGFALFSLTLICALAFAMLSQFVFDWRARREAQKIASNRVTDPVPFASPLSLHRWIITGFLLTILLGAFPDVLVLFMWGEAEDTTMERLFIIDRLGDGLTIFPFTVSATLSAWGIQVLPQQLISTRVLLQRPKWETVKAQVKIIGMVLVIAIGVTLAKAGT
jgi:glycopeptide antibiotics resistance protein